MMLGMTPEAMAFVVFSVGMLVLMGIGVLWMWRLARIQP